MYATLDRPAPLTPVLLAVSVGIASAIAPNIMPLLVASFSRVFDLTPAAAGRITGAEMFGVFIGSLAIAGLLKRFSVSTLMAASLSMIVAGNLLTVLLGLEALAVVRFIAGLGEGAGVAAMAAVLAGTATPERFFGMYVFGTYLFATVIFREAATITAIGGRFGAFWLLALFATIALPAALLTSKPSPKTFSPQPTAAITHRSSVLLVVIALIGMTLYLAAWTNTWAYAVNLGGLAGFTAEGCSRILSYAVVAGVIGASLAIIIGPRLGNFAPMLGAGSVMLAAAVLIATHLNTVTYTIAMLAWTGGMQLIGPYFVALASAADREGRAASLSIAAQTLGLALGPLIGSVVVGTGNYNLLIVTSIALLISGLITVLTVERLLARQVT